MTCTYLSQLIISFKHTRVQESFLHLQHTRPQLSLDGAGLRGLDAGSVNSSSDYYAYLYIPASKTTHRQKRMPIADRSHRRRKTVETSCKKNPWIARLQGVREVLLFYRACSSLVPMSSNFSSVSTRRLCFCFLSIKSPVVLSLFSKL
jgi:hypothetical protein